MNGHGAMRMGATGVLGFADPCDTIPDEFDESMGPIMEEFGCQVVYHPPGVPVLGIFRQDYTRVDPRTGTEVNVRAPNFVFRRSDLPAYPVPHRDTVTDCDGLRWKVVEVHRNGAGVDVLVRNEP